MPFANLFETFPVNPYHTFWNLVNSGSLYSAKISADFSLLYIITPSLEWAARKILEEESLHGSVLASLFGSQENEWAFHRCGFTIMLLRQAVRMAGLHDMEAYQGAFGIKMESGIIKAQQNIVVGWKVITDGEET